MVTAPTIDASRVGFLQAIALGLAEEMERDENVIVLGQGVEAGTYGTTFGLRDRFGPLRVRDTPISEGAECGIGVGAAMCGLRPFVDLTIASFAYLAMDQMIHQAAKNRFLFGGQAKVPVVFHFSLYHRSYASAQHNDRPHPMLMGVPGLKIVAAQTPSDARGLVKTAIREDDPVVFLSDMVGQSSREALDLDDVDACVPLGSARVVREGSDATIVPIFSLASAVEAAATLAAEGIDVEIIDPRSLYPFDWRTVLTSVAKTKRLVVVDIAHSVCSAASEVAATVSEELFGELTAPVARVCTPMVHVPYAPNLEPQMYPDAAKVADAVRRLVS
jgi:pyruvate dehydrogenase E1 component beta subunit